MLPTKKRDRKHGGFYVTIDLLSWGHPLTSGSNVRVRQSSTPPDFIVGLWSEAFWFLKKNIYGCVFCTTISISWLDHVPSIIIYKCRAPFDKRRPKTWYSSTTTRTKYERQPRKLGSCRLDMNGTSLKTRLKTSIQLKQI